MEVRITKVLLYVCLLVIVIGSFFAKLGDVNHDYLKVNVCSTPGNWMMSLCCYHTGDKLLLCTTSPQGDNDLLLYNNKQSSGKQVDYSCVCM